jgi:hypothetical protein
LLRIELLRVLEAWRLLVALGCIVVSIAISYTLLGSFQAQAGGSLAGSSALDVFYVGLNDSLVACILLPTGALALCGDAFTKEERGGFSDVVLSRLSNRRVWLWGKCLCITVTCLLYAIATLALMCIFDMGAFGTTPSVTVPQWLAYSGNPDDYQWNRYFARIALVPESWNYALLVVVLALVEGAVLSVMTITFASCAAAFRAQVNPLLLGFAILLALTALPELFANVAFLLNPSLPQSDWGFLMDRFCLCFYCLGASFFQTEVGQAAEITSQFDGQEIVASAATQVNNYATLVLVLLLLAGLSLLALFHRYGDAGVGRLKARTV